MKRRTFLQSGIAAILSAGVAPAAIGSGILMPVREIIKPEDSAIVYYDWAKGLAMPDYLRPIYRDALLAKGWITSDGGEIA